MKLKIIYEDQALLVIDKPSGIVVNRVGTTKGKTLQDWMEEKYPACFKINENLKDNQEWQEFHQRSGIVHRLDRETSGVMVLTKKLVVFQNLKAQFKLRKVSKEYLALVHGRVTPKQGDIKLPLGRNPKKRKHFTIRLGGREAVTNYQVLAYYQKNGHVYSLLSIQPKTGRTHQIRVHCKHIGHSLVADSIYLKKNLRQDLKWCPRLFLHAHKLVFTHPITGKRREFVSKLSTDLEQALTYLTKKN